MDKKIIVSLFESYERAHATADRLEAAGFAYDDISVIDQDSARTRSWQGSAHTTAGTGGGAYIPALTMAPGYAAAPAAGLMVPTVGAAGAGILGAGTMVAGAGLPVGGTSHAADRAASTSVSSLAHWLTDEGVDETDAHAYAEGVRRGSAVLAVRCNEADVDRAVSIIDDDGALDIDERQAAWRTEGWGGHNDTADRPEVSGAGSKEQVIPIVEEELQVSKRQVSRGRVRIHSHVSEKPVQEQVSLRQEHVEVERRPSDRLLTGTAPAGGDPFRDRTIEVQETSEEPVVSKEARVKEELVVRKDVDQRTETVSDTVRSTEVKIDDERHTAKDRKTL